MSRTEVLVLLVLVIVFAAASIFWFNHFSPQAKLARGMTSARTLNTVLAQYATDNNGVYPVGEGTPAAGKSEGIAQNLLQNNYLPDATVFAVGSTSPYGGKAADFSDLTPANLSWDFTAGTDASTGVPAAAPDLLPIVFTTGETVTYPRTAGQGSNVTLSGQGPFGLQGMIVAYKGGNVIFLRPSDSPPVCRNFISPLFTDTATYTQIKP